DAAVAREREDPFLGLAIDRVVGDLHEVERIASHQLLDFAMTPSFGRRDPDVSDLACRLQREEGRQVLLPVEQVMDLHEVEAADLPVLARLFDLLAPTRARRPDL